VCGLAIFARSGVSDQLSHPGYTFLDPCTPSHRQHTAGGLHGPYAPRYGGAGKGGVFMLKGMVSETRHPGSQLTGARSSPLQAFRKPGPGNGNTVPNSLAVFIRASSCTLAARLRPFA